MIVFSPLLARHLQPDLFGHELAEHELEKGQEQTLPLNPPQSIPALLPPQSLRCNIIRPTLAYLGVNSNAAENLLLGTLLTLAWLPTDKLGRDGIGPYAISAAVHTRLWDDYLALRPDLASLIRGLASQRRFLQDPHAELAYNLAYATAIAWMLYQQQADCLDDCADMPALARVWQRAYPHLGASARDFISSWKMTHGDQDPTSA
ncbi:MAG: hypothetical protein R6V43_03065 [Halopseudomonas sp.]